MEGWKSHTERKSLESLTERNLTLKGNLILKGNHSWLKSLQSSGMRYSSIDIVGVVGCRSEYLKRSFAHINVSTKSKWVHRATSLFLLPLYLLYFLLRSS